jgi:hypothetical protein
MMETGFIEKRNINPQQAIEILKKSGVEISEEEAEKVLDVLYFLAELIVEQNFKK